MTPHRILASSVLLTALLAACGSTPQNVSPAPSLTTQAATPKIYILTVKITATTTAASLATTYPGSTVLSFKPAEGYALVSVNSYKTSTSILVAEKNEKIKHGDSGVGAQGFSTWAGGFSLWAGGFSLWAGGTTTGTSFTENTAIWNRIELSAAQQLVPELGRGVKVAVIDSGLDLNHPAFSGKLDLTNDYDYVDGDSTPQDVNPNTDGTFAAGYGHGTAVAGVILQVAPNVTILPLRVLGPDGGGDSADVISAIDRAVTAGAKVINLSLGSASSISGLNSAISSAVQKGVVVISSAGNSGDTNVTYPAASSLNTGSAGTGQIGVGSVSPLLTKSTFSTYGSKLEMTAIGENVKTLFPGSQTVSASGTSFAAPMVAGAAALAISTFASGTYTTSAATTLLKNINSSAQAPQDPVYGFQLGSGTLNAYSLVNLYR